MKNNFENRSAEEPEVEGLKSEKLERAPKKLLEEQANSITTQTAERGYDRFGTGKAIRAGVLLLAIATGCGRSGVKEKGHPTKPGTKTEMRQSIDEGEEREKRQPTERDILSAFRQFGFSAKSRGDGNFEVRIADNFGNSDCYKVGPDVLQELRDIQKDFEKRANVINRLGTPGLETNRIKRNIVEPRMIGAVRRCEKLGFEQLSPEMQKLMQGDQQRKGKVKAAVEKSPTYIERKNRELKIKQSGGAKQIDKQEATEKVAGPEENFGSKKGKEFEVKSAQGRKILEHERDINRLRMMNLELANMQEKLDDWQDKINSEGGRNTKNRAELEVFLTKIREFNEKRDERDALADKINDAKRHKQVWGEF